MLNTLKKYKKPLIIGVTLLVIVIIIVFCAGNSINNKQTEINNNIETNVNTEVETQQSSTDKDVNSTVDDENKSAETSETTEVDDKKEFNTLEHPRILNPGSEDWIASRTLANFYLGPDASAELYDVSLIPSDKGVHGVGAIQGREKVASSTDEYLEISGKELGTHKDQVNMFTYNKCGIPDNNDRPDIMLNYDLSDYLILNYANLQQGNTNYDMYNVVGLTEEDFINMIESLIESGMEVVNTTPLVDNSVRKSLENSQEDYVIMLREVDEDLKKVVTFCYFGDCALYDYFDQAIYTDTVVSISVALPLNKIKAGE